MGHDLRRAEQLRGAGLLRPRPARQIQNPVTGSRSVANVLATKAIAQATGVTLILGTGRYYDSYFDVDWLSGPRPISSPST
jgi:hypothetical protein